MLHESPSFHTTAGPRDRLRDQHFPFIDRSSPLRPYQEQAVITDLAEYLRAFDAGYVYNSATVLLRRAHHQESDWYFTLMGGKEGLISSQRYYEQEGLPPSPELYPFIAHHWVRYFTEVLPHKTRPVRIDDAGHTIPYNIDIAGTTPAESWQFLTDMSLETIQFLRAPGTTTVKLTGRLDYQCEGCALGMHCTEGRIPLPNSNIPAIHPLDARIIMLFLTLNPDNPNVIVREKSEAPEQLRSLLGTTTVATEIETPLSVYRATLDRLNQVLYQQHHASEIKDL